MMYTWRWMSNIQKGLVIRECTSIQYMFELNTCVCILFFLYNYCYCMRSSLFFIIHVHVYVVFKRHRSYPFQTPSDMPRCEKGFGCFKSCSGDACDAVVLWRRQENVVDFRIMSRPTNPDHRWVAIGLSPNGKMVCAFLSNILLCVCV